MEYQEMLPRIRVSRRDMLKRVARFGDLKGFDGGLPDSKMPGCERTLFNVIGFQPPNGEGNGMQSPVGAKASRMAAIKISEGFNMGYCKAYPGKGPLLHNHDTNETFVSMTGTWRASWENTKGEIEHVDLKPLDVISFPPGVSRRFENVTRGPKNKQSILMFVIGGDGPRAEFTKDSMSTVVEAGAWTPPGAKPMRKKAAAKPAAKKAAKEPAAKRSMAKKAKKAKK
ncbi:MAG: cupin 2 protein [Betaproteobacteria bacterium]|nr:cupin 2 protein [Betaproteobacteria bacterium]